ncbi:MAG TPA: hypothetical protein VFB14_17750 [Bryobacteraceae bacterium]|jgi:hypothetical protein|nr:hypothetical protein [Bryobacteraceae bacterium]
MEKNTPCLLMLMVGLLLGRLVPLPQLEVVEITTLFILAFCHRGNILNGVRRLATRPQVRAYVVPRYAKAHQHVASFGVVKMIAFAAGILLGGLLLAVDALQRAAH